MRFALVPGLLRAAAAFAAALCLWTVLDAQNPAAPAADPARAAPVDPLGRSTPRGTVVGFLAAAGREDYTVAAEYLDARMPKERATALAEQLFVVLDARLPARIMRISDAPEGSHDNPLTPDRETAGSIASANGNVAVVLERVRRRGAEPVWLFSTETLDAVPRLHAEVVASPLVAMVPKALTRSVLGLRLVDWLTVLFGIPLLYFLAILLNRAVTPFVGVVWRRLSGRRNAVPDNVVPAPARVIIVVFAAGWLVAMLPLSLPVRQLWTAVSTMIIMGAAVWLLMVVNARIETQLRRRRPWAAPAAASLLRLARRGVDVLLVFVGILVLLRYYGIDPTPALAGLGVGGIAVALAAQKTLENVIAGASLIFDQAVRIGDSLRVGDVTGTVDHIGLRSTRIRTLDRTVVSIPNGQIANASVETLSVRDRFWFRHVVQLRSETTAEQLQAVTEGIKRLLDQHPRCDRASVRVRFFRLGTSSLDVEAVAYLSAMDWDEFMALQESLLFAVIAVVHGAGTRVAMPSQMNYAAEASGEASSLPAP